MSERERERQRDGGGPEPEPEIGEDRSNIRRDAADLRAAGADAIRRALSGNSMEFLAETRQESGQ